MWPFQPLIPGSAGGTPKFATTTDAVTAADANVRVATLVRAPTDSVTAADAATRQFTGLRSIVDAVTSSDAATRTVTFGRTATDALNAVDVAAGLKTLVRAVVDALNAVDASVRTVTNNRTTANTVTAADVVTALKLIARDAIDAVTFSDVATGLKGYARVLADAVTASESVQRIGIFLRTAVQSIGSVFHIRTAHDEVTVADSPRRAVTNIRFVNQSVDTADVATRIVVPQSGSRLKRSIPCFSSATVTFLINNGDALNLGADGDIFLLAVGGSNNPVTASNITFVNSEANRLKAAYPDNPCGFHTSGTDDVQTLAQSTNDNVTYGNFNYEVNLGEESEHFSLNQAVAQVYFDQAHDYCIANGKIPVCSPSGRFFPFSSMTYEGFNASDLGYDWMPPIIGSVPGAPYVIQCQTHAKSQAAGTNNNFNNAWNYMVNNPGVNGSWFPQITINLGEVNGVTASDGLEVLSDAIAAHGRPDGISVWSNSTVAGEFRSFLLGTKDL